MPRPRRNLASLLLAASLLTPWAASAAPSSPVELRAHSSAGLTTFWSLLTTLWAEAGCIIDPNGGGCAGPKAAVPDLGCGIDPNGGCHGGAQSTAPAPPAVPDLGCVIDPSGRCESTH
jgi:hypothetical protein